MTIKEARTVLSNSTPVTTAIAVSLCLGAFVAGRAIENLSTRVEEIEFRRLEMHEETREWRAAQVQETKRITDLLYQMSEVSRDNKRRLDELTARH